MDSEIAAFLDTLEIPPTPNIVTFDTEAEIKNAIGGVNLWNESNHKFFHFNYHNDLEDFVNKCPTEYRTYHERIYADQPQKIRFDVDAKAIDGNHTINLEQLDEIKSAICTVFNNTYRSQFAVITYQDLMVCDSSDDTKRSVHIIVKGYHVINNIEARNIAELVKNEISAELKPLIDTGIYKSATGLRLALNHINLLKVVSVIL